MFRQSDKLSGKTQNWGKEGDIQARAIAAVEEVLMTLTL